ncbi:MAG: hypothetical protein J0L84_16970 [Verrucomicrobia bacterium]|nr:hypothetical protein [Verrucomicrobiota bacterium]
MSREHDATFDPVGLLRLGADGRLLDTVELEPAIYGTLCLESGREGVLWAGGKGGLFRVTPVPLSTMAFGRDEFFGRNCRVVGFEPSGALWFASECLTGRWSRDTIELTLLASSQTNGYHIGLPPLALDPGERMVSKTAAGQSLAFSSGSDGFPSMALAGKPNPVTALIPCRDGILRVAVAEWLFQVFPTGRIDRMPQPSPSPVLSMAEDPQGVLWIGTAGHGLLRWDGVAFRAGTDRSGNAGAIHALHADAEGRLWMGTASGLSLCVEGVLHPIGAAAGLPDGVIHGILEDDMQRLWVSHAEGLFRAAKGDLLRWTRDRESAVPITEFGPREGLLLRGGVGAHPCVRGPDGRLWFGRQGGLAVVDPSETPDLPPPRVFVERVVANGEARVPGVAGTVLRLPAGGGRRLEVEYVATTLHSPGKTRFRHRLEGRDAGWRDAGGERTARYQNLPEGHYTFRVQAKNHQGRWSEREAALVLHVVPHFWETGVFRAAAGMAISGSVASVALWGFRRQRRTWAERQRAALEGERTRIARDLHDHLGASLTQAALRREAAPDRAQPIRESLHVLRDLIWLVHPENDTLESLAGFIGDYSTRFLADAGLGVHLDLPDAFPDGSIPGEVRREIAALLKESLRNVVAHAAATRVVVRARVRGDQFVLTVEDDGRGFDASPAGGRLARPMEGGHGLANLQSRCAHLGGDFRIRSAAGQGTQVDFIIPLATLRSRPLSS